jgi:two-component system OmpR family response regulator
MKILLIEDDIETTSHVVAALRAEGHQVDHAASGREGLGMAVDGAYAVAIVDRMLPGMDGLSLVRLMRAAELQTRVIFVTTMVGINDRVEGFEAGGDDYLVKPFAMTELLARVESLARRNDPKREDTVLSVGDLEFNLVRRQVKRGARTIELQPQEMKLLEVLMRNAGRIVTRTMLFEQVWDFQFEPKTSIVETQVSRLRSKIDSPGEPSLIETVRGSGYRLGSTH